jgi:hypothetical protein
MVDFFVSRLSACEDAITKMNLCLNEETAKLPAKCAEEDLISYKKMVLVFCSDPASQESKLGETGNIVIKNVLTCATPSTSGGAVLASDCTEDDGRRLEQAGIGPFAVSDGTTTFTASSVDYSHETDTFGVPKSLTASLTGPDPAFELDVKVELSPFKSLHGKVTDEIEFQEPAGKFWLNTLTLWQIGVSPKVKGAIAAAKAATGGVAVTTAARQLTPDKEEGKTAGATLGDFEKATVATHVLKLSQTGIHHMILKKRAQMSWLALLGYSLGAVLLVVLALGACRSLLHQKKGYVAPEDQDEEAVALAVDQSMVDSE